MFLYAANPYSSHCLRSLELAQCYFTPVNKRLQIIFSSTLSCLDIYFNVGLVSRPLKLI